MTQRIDRFIEAMFRKQAEQLLFGTGSPVRIRVAGEEKIILDKAVRTEQIVKLLAPIANAQSITESGEQQYFYDSPAGRVRVRTCMSGTRISAIVSPHVEAEYDGFSLTGELSGLSVDMERAVEPSVAPSPSMEPVPTEAPHPGASVREMTGHRQPPPEAAPMIGIHEPPLEALGGHSRGRGGMPSGSDAGVPEGATMPAVIGSAPPAHPDAAHALHPSHVQQGQRPSSSEAHAAPVFGTLVSPPAHAVDASAPKAFAIDTILRALVNLGGSDLHLTSGHVPMVRKDGDMMPVEGWDALASPTIEAWLLEVANDGARIAFQKDHDADFAHEIENVARFRVNIFRDRNGVGGVVRTIPSEILTADQLQLPHAIRQMCQLPKGLVLVTGPTGSGKSTTLAAMVDLINKTRSDHIITIEDPVEFVHQSKKCLVNQREVHTHTKSFSSALRAALREDPDIVLVGELRDLDTVHIAIETAETGHLVFGTLHTNTAPSTVDRIIDQFPADQQAQIRVMLSESLRAVVSQTLLRRKAGGRVAALEILLVNHAVANLIREGKTFQIPSIMQTGKSIGMQTQNDVLTKLVVENVVTPAEALAKAADPSALTNALQRAGYAAPSK